MVERDSPALLYPPLKEANGICWNGSPDPIRGPWYQNGYGIRKPAV